MPKVSVIIPFYNVEDYIDDCIKSVLAQSLKDIEVILINDASTDKTRKIVQKYADKDDRIKIIDLDKQYGQGYARNRGMEIAKGDYIGFVDSDDFIDADMYKTLYKRAKDTNSDITMCQASEYDDMNKIYSSSDLYKLTILGSLGDTVFPSEATKDYLLDINVALWNKIYKRSYLLGTKEKFPEGYVYEDLPFFFGTYLPAKRISIVWKILYNYRVNRKNSTMQQYNAKILDRPPMVSLTYEKIKKLPYFDEISDRVKGWIIDDLFHRYILLKESFHREFFFLMKKIFKSLDIKNPEDAFWKTIYHFQGYILVMNNTFEKFNQTIFTEYFDIQKLEERLKVAIDDTSELDRRFDLVYDDLNKTYKYSEKIQAEINQNIDNKAEWIDTQINEKISKIYDEITKNYDYTNSQNELINENIHDNIVSLGNENAQKVSELYDAISQNYKYTDERNEETKKIIDDKAVWVNSQTDEKISKVYDAISQNYKYTDERNEETKKIIGDKAVWVNSQTDEKISKVYDDISKNYKYTDEKNEETKQIIEYKAEWVNSQTDEKISKVYDEISKSYEYSNNLNEQNKQERIKEKEEILADIKNKTELLSNNTNDKIMEITEEISNLYAYTNKERDYIYTAIYQNKEYTDNKSNELKDSIEWNIKEKSQYIYSDIKDLSIVMQENYKELSSEQNNLKQNTSDIINRIENNENWISSVNNDINGKINDISNRINNNGKETTDTINQIKNTLEFEKQNNQNLINQIKAEFRDILEGQQKKHEEEVQELKDKIKSLEIELREEMKSPLEKLISKYKEKSKNTEK